MHVLHVESTHQLDKSLEADKNRYVVIDRNIDNGLVGIAFLTHKMAVIDID